MARFDFKQFFTRASQCEIPPELAALGLNPKLLGAAQREAEAVDARGPTIAYVGDCGVGKETP